MRVKGELFNDFDAVEQAAQGRLDRSHQNILFDRLHWFHRVSRYSSPQKTPIIAHAQTDTAEAWLFLEHRTARTAASLTNWYTLAFRPVFSGDTDRIAKTALVTDMALLLATRVSQIELSPVPENDGSADLILSGFRNGGWIGFKSPKTVSWTIDVTGETFAQFWAKRPGQVRSTHDRKLKKYGTTCEIHTEFDATTWAIYEEIYAESWKGEEGSLAFVRSMVEAKGQAGALRLGIARHDGRPIAAQLWTTENGRAIIHKLAYRADAAELSAGTVLSAAMFRHAIDVDRVNIIDYGTGDDRYKADWMDKRDILFQISLYNPKTITGLFGAMMTWVSRLVRRKTVQ